MNIELTPEQIQALQGHPDQPIRVVDPMSRREYILMSRDEFDRLRPPAYPSIPHQNHSAPSPLPVPQRLAVLPTPPEVAEEARRRYTRWWKAWGVKSLGRIEQELKLQYYYGGRMICCLRNDDGLEIVIVHDGDDEKFHRQYRTLSAELRERAVCMSLPIWKDDVSELPSAFYSHESDH